MALKLANNATGRLAVSIAPTATTIVLQPGEGSKFPSLLPGDWFPLTALRPDNTREIMYATARSGDIITVQRGQENTSTLSFITNDRIELRGTAGVYGNYLPLAGGSISGALSVGGNLSTAGTFNATGAITQNGQQVWHAANFNPAVKADLSGATFTGKVNTANINGAMAVSDATSSFEVRNVPGASGDGGMAMIGFLAQGVYGIKMGLRADGYFGLGGWSRPAWSLYSDNAGNLVAAGNVSAYSDPRLKDDVRRIDGALDIIQQLDGVRFTWNHKTTLIGRPGERDIGVLADQVEAVLPELVGLSIPDDANGGQQWRVVAYEKLTPVLIEAIKELSARIKVLEGE